MTPTISFATSDDLGYLTSREDIAEDVIVKKIKNEEYIVAKNNDVPVGYLRFSFFWSKIPYIDIIKVEENYRKQGIGSRLLEFLEKYAVEKGQTIIMSSSQKDETEPQEWHRRMGFREAGIIKNFSPIQDVPEIIFIKEVKR